MLLAISLKKHDFKSPKKGRPTTQGIHYHEIHGKSDVHNLIHMSGEVVSKTKNLRTQSQDDNLIIESTANWKPTSAMK